MTCTPIALGDGATAIVCTRGKRKRECCKCKGKALRLCDAPVRPGTKKTCDAPLCDTCRVEYRLPGRAEPLDVCPYCVRHEARWLPAPRVEVRRIVGLSLPPPWPALVALGVCPLLSLPKSTSLLWAEYVAIHASSASEDATAHQLAASAGVEVPVHPLSSVREAVVAVARVRRPLWACPGRGWALSPWAHGPSLLQVEDCLPLHPVPWRGPESALPWELPAELRDEVARAFAAARKVREHLREEEREEAVHAERQGKLQAEVDELLSLRVEPPPLRPVPVAAPEDPFEAVVRRYNESLARTRDIAAKYNGYRRSAQGMDAAGIKGYLCPHCAQWFTWHPGCYPHQCPAEARP